uniref:Uncharacterized protein AlNc14C2G232 n=1 Tax=Albugo laibachii Nc14 TaxID=890382 RepID=F0VZ91_9STRA|nr:hypothetical protein PITG_03674 [Albugo laibachii Nc14]|eukprot:CCA14121.1 hypothetical protein PITG_03674 [Albugo laibachii Nc14]
MGSERIPCFALIVVSSTQQGPSLPDCLCITARKLFDTLIDTKYAKFVRRGSQLLLNPSIIEFRNELQELSHKVQESLMKQKSNNKSDKPSTFVCCFIAQTACVRYGRYPGEYVLFRQSRVATVDELRHTAMHTTELATYLQAIPCANKLLALQINSSVEIKVESRFFMKRKMEEDFASALYQQMRSGSSEQNMLVLEYCQASVDDKRGVPAFLERIFDVFQGAVIDVTGSLEDSYISSDHFCTYLVDKLAQVRRKDVILRPTTEKACECVRIHGDRSQAFVIGMLPDPPSTITDAVTPLDVKTRSITVSWELDRLEGSMKRSKTPAILAYQVQYRRTGRAFQGLEHCWKQAGGLQRSSYEQVERNHKRLPTQITFHGLPNDTSVIIRFRAANAGGWSMWSPESKPIRTRSYTTVTTYFDTVRIAFESSNIVGVLHVMEKNEVIAAIQRIGLGILAQSLQIPVDPSNALLNNARLQEKAVDISLASMKRFVYDALLHRHAAEFLERMAKYVDIHRARKVMEESIELLTRYKVDFSTMNALHRALKRSNDTTARHPHLQSSNMKRA